MLIEREKGNEHGKYSLFLQMGLYGLVGNAGRDPCSSLSVLHTTAL